jgi:hypothetical protein
LPEGVGAGLYDLEMRAWVTTVLDSFGSRQKTLTLPGGYVILDSTWAPAEVNQKVDSAIQGFLSEEELLHQ